MMPTEETSSSPSETPQDGLHEEATALVIDMQTASISLLQRRFRASDITELLAVVDELEEHGVIGPSTGSKPREVLLQKAEELENPLEE